MRGLGDAILTLYWICLLSVPLAVWKLIEILWWLAANVTVGLR
jgi:hypothetical protein